VVSAPVRGAGGADLPSANAASTAVEKIGHGHRATCGDIYRQARHPRRTCASGQASPRPHRLTGALSGGGTLATSDSPVCEAPHGARNAALGRTTSRTGGRRRKSGAGCGGYPVRMEAWPVPPSRSHPNPLGPPRGERHPGYPNIWPHVPGRGRSPSVSPQGSEGGGYSGGRPTCSKALVLACVVSRGRRSS